MRFYEHGSKWKFTVALSGFILWALSGCSTVGPATISGGRAAYNEALKRTNEQQMLMAVVNRRYGEGTSLLAVSNVTANVRFSANAGFQVGYGSSSSYEGNLVPFGGGFAYEENPTITYTPVQGVKYLRQILKPMPLDILLLYLDSSYQSGIPLLMLAKRVNGISNPDFLPSARAEPDPRFLRLVELLSDLHMSNVLYLAKNRGEQGEYDVVISHYAPDCSQEVSEFLTILGQPMPSDQSEEIVLPLYSSWEGLEKKGITITTRSVFDLIQILTASVEIPSDPASEERAVKFPARGTAGRDIRIRVSTEKPDNASAMVKYRKHWYFIDDNDQITKLAFRLFIELWGMIIAGSAERQPAPVLTVPVSQ